MPPGDLLLERIRGGKRLSEADGGHGPRVAGAPRRWHAAAEGRERADGVLQEVEGRHSEV